MILYRGNLLCNHKGCPYIIYAIVVEIATLRSAPFGFADIASTKPLCASANRFTSASPRPVPVVSRFDSSAIR